MRIKRIDHIGIVLGEQETLKSIFKDVLGLKVGHEEIYRGGEGDENICFIHAGDTEVELCSSVDPSGESARSVSEKGHHIEHIAFEVEDIENAIRELKKKGIPLMQEAPIPGARGSHVVFIDTRATSNIMIELVQANPCHEPDEMSG